MKTIWVIVLSLIALVLGAFGGLAWKGGTTAFAGLKTTCEIMQVAESSGIMTKAQIEDTLNRLQKSLAEKGRASDGLEKLAADIRETCKSITPAKKS